MTRTTEFTDRFLLTDQVAIITGAGGRGIGALTHSASSSLSNIWLMTSASVVATNVNQLDLCGCGHNE